MPPIHTCIKLLWNCLYGWIIADIEIVISSKNSTWIKWESNEFYMSSNAVKDLHTSPNVFFKKLISNYVTNTQLPNQIFMSSNAVQDQCISSDILFNIFFTELYFKHIIIQSILYVINRCCKAIHLF